MDTATRLRGWIRRLSLVALVLALVCLVLDMVTRHFYMVIVDIFLIAVICLIAWAFRKATQ